MADEEQQCVFCHIASGKIPAKKVYEDDKVAAVLDINPAAPGHILVVPKNHVAIMPQMAEDLVVHLGMIAKQLSHALIRALKVDGTSVFVANGVAAGQRAPHFLLHVIPRGKDDEIGLQPPVVKIDEKVASQVYDKLVKSVSKQFGKEPPIPKIEMKKEEKMPEKKDEKPASKSKLDELTEFLTKK
jgi:histidine triad (HIT) family protein